MGVRVRAIKTLSLDEDNARYYQKQAMVNDTITLFGTNNQTLRGMIYKITSSYLYITQEGTKKLAKIPLNEIKAFNVDFRGELSRNYFG